MIYDSLRKLPKVTQIEIIETGDLSLLTDEHVIYDDLDETPGIKIEKLVEVWNNLNEEFSQTYHKAEASKILNASKEIEYQSNRYVIIKYSCEALLFNYSDDLIQLLQNNQYKISKDNYLNDIEKILRECEGIIDKINNLKKQLPKKKEDSNDEYSIIDIMASYTVILGYDFDFYTISVEKFHSLEKSVNEKIKQLAKSNSNTTK